MYQSKWGPFKLKRPTSTRWTQNSKGTLLIWKGTNLMFLVLSRVGRGLSCSMSKLSTWCGVPRDY